MECIGSIIKSMRVSGITDGAYSTDTLNLANVTAHFAQLKLEPIEGSTVKEDIKLVILLK